MVATEGGGRSAGKGLEQEATSRVPWESKTHVEEASASARRVRKRWDFSLLEERSPRGRGPERDRRRDRFSNPSECKNRKTKMRHAKSQAELQPANKTWKKKKSKKSQVTQPKNKMRRNMELLYWEKDEIKDKCSCSQKTKWVLCFTFQ